MEVGDVVRLKSGGPRMTLMSIDVVVGRVAWFADWDEEPREMIVRLACLELAPSALSGSVVNGGWASWSIAGSAPDPAADVETAPTAADNAEAWEKQESLQTPSLQDELAERAAEWAADRGKVGEPVRVGDIVQFVVDQVRKRQEEATVPPSKLSDFDFLKYHRLKAGARYVWRGIVFEKMADGMACNVPGEDPAGYPPL